jgi:hypothetical protein
MSKYNFFQKVSVTGATFPTTPQTVFDIKYQNSFLLLNEGDTKVEYSFDGSTLHGDLTPSTPSAGIAFDNRIVDKIWFRTSSGTQIVRVEAWSHS